MSGAAGAAPVAPPPAPGPAPARGVAPRGPTTGGEIQVRAPGSIVVVGDRLQLRRERLHALASALEATRQDLAAARRQGPWSEMAGAPVAARRFDDDLQVAAVDTAEAARRAADLDARLTAALVAYAEAERTAERAQRALGSLLANLVAGSGLPILGALALVQISPAVLLAFALHGVPPEGIPQEVGDWLVAHPEIITDPAFVEAVRLVATSSDDAALGTAQVPPGLSLLLGEDALGLTGVGFGGIALMAALRPLGLFRETPVAVTRIEPSTPATAPPSGMVERLERVPDDGIVRIERYDAPGQPTRWEVYVPPTATFSPAPGPEPFDMVSNVGGVAGLEAGSIRAVELAMREAGIPATDEVQFTGFSQGGMVAARLAASGDWNAVGLASYGGPTATVDLPEGLAGMAIRNTDDFVPAFAGAEGDSPLLQIERRAFEPGDPMPLRAAPAHQREGYLGTAAAVDHAKSAVVRDQIAALDDFGQSYLDAGGSVTTYEFETERLPAGSGSGGGAGGGGSGV